MLTLEEIGTRFQAEDVDLVPISSRAFRPL